MGTVADDREPAFELSGGALCLDFANTVGDRPACANDKLRGPGDLLRWGEAAGLVDASARRRLARESSRRGARAAFRRALELREVLYRIFAATAAGARSRPGDLAVLNRALGRALPELRLVDRGAGFAWAWRGKEPTFERILWPVVRSAAELLASDEAGLVRECASDRCSWLFLDRSRTRRRRWCSMKTCGNRAKARRYYERRKRGD